MTAVEIRECEVVRNDINDKWNVGNDLNGKYFFEQYVRTRENIFQASFSCLENIVNVIL